MPAPLLLHVYSTFAVGGPQVRFAALAAALSSLLADPQLRERLGRANRQRAEAEYDQQAMFAAWYALFAGPLPPAAAL